jgi:hypothetical protein
MKALALTLLMFTVLAVSAGSDPKPIVVTAVGPAEPQFVASVTTQAEQMLQRLVNEYHLVLTHQITMVLARTPEEFRKAQPPGSNLPSWAAGVAYPEKNLIIIKTADASTSEEFRRLLSHELAHVVLGHLFGKSPVPLWLNEGLAMHLSDDWGLDRQIALFRAQMTDRLIPLESLMERFPDKPVDAATAYAESYYLISFLKDKFGGAVVGRLIQDLSLGVNTRHALYKASGLWPHQFEEEFFKWLRQRFSILWLLVNPDFLWTVIAVFLLAAYLNKRRSAARKRAAWEAEADESGKITSGPGGNGTEDGSGGSL